MNIENEISIYRLCFLLVANAFSIGNYFTPFPAPWWALYTSLITTFFFSEWVMYRNLKDMALSEIEAIG
jgi:hypothetical protein